MKTLVREKTTSPTLSLMAQRWLEIDGAFTEWIHDYAKQQMNEDEILALAESEGDRTRQVYTAWNEYMAAKSPASESLLVESLGNMISFRVHSMKR